MPTSFSLNDIVLSVVVLFLIAVVIVMHLRRKDSPLVLSSPQDNCHEDAFKLLPEAILMLNAEQKLVYLNPAAEQMLSCKLRSIMGKHQSELFELLHLQTRRVLQGLFDQGKKSEVVDRECLLQTSMNQAFPVQLNLIPMLLEGKGELHSLIVLKNIAEKKALESKLSNLETYDSMTRMLNRRSFEASVKQLIDNAHKHDASHVLAYFSIDQFQVLNDTIGHSGGDALIENVGEIIKTPLHEGMDVSGRMGGSTFSVIFRDRKLASCVKQIESILADVAEYKFAWRGQQYPVSLSAGFVIIDSQSTSAQRVISEATRACSLANKTGGNRLLTYRAENDDIQKQEGNLEWVMILKNAIQNNLFEMYAQPIHRLEPDEYKKSFTHYELLIRLSDKKGNPISPGEFISAAEYYSMMPALDRWVIHDVLQRISKIPDQPNLPVFAINLSGQSLNDSRFLDFVLNEIKTSGVDPQMLCFEITEQVAVEDINLVNIFVSKLKALGSKFSLDDFGTGVSSFGYLRSLDVDYLKIDGSFVKNIAVDDVAKAMVQSINQVAHTMNLKVIAEYLENKEILVLLQEMGVDYGQGYYISKPKPMMSMIQHHMKV